MQARHFVAVILERLGTFLLLTALNIEVVFFGSLVTDLDETKLNHCVCVCVYMYFSSSCILIVSGHKCVYLGVYLCCLFYGD